MRYHVRQKNNHPTGVHQHVVDAAVLVRSAQQIVTVGQSTKRAGYYQNPFHPLLLPHRCECGGGCGFLVDSQLVLAAYPDAVQVVAARCPEVDRGMVGVARSLQLLRILCFTQRCFVDQ